jgi:tetratricopeptide (TPR) repeat protein
LGQWDIEVANRREAVEICIDLGDRERMGKSFIELAEALSFTGRLGEATEAAYRGLGYLGPHVSANRAHLLCVLAGILKFTQGYDAASEALREALEIARHLPDPKLKARLFCDRCRLNNLFLHLREAIADGLLSEESGGLEALPQERNALLNNLLMARLYMGHMEDALRIADEIESRIKKAGPFNTDPISRCAKMWIEFGRNADLASYETELGRALESEQTMEHWNVLSETYLALVNFLRGNWSAALVHLRSLGRSKQSERINGFSLATLFFVLSYIGDRDGALTILEENRMLLPRLDQHNWSGSWWVLALVVEGLTMLGERSQAGELYPLARKLIDTGAVLMWPLCRFTQTTAGIAAAARREWDISENHLRIALAQAQSVPYRLEEAEIRRFHAMMLLDRAAPGDHERARTLVGEALDLYTRIGMRRHAEVINNLLEQTYG